jgi:hypothetical protein
MRASAYHWLGLHAEFAQHWAHLKCIPVQPPFSGLLSCQLPGVHNCQVELAAAGLFAFAHHPYMHTVQCVVLCRLLPLYNIICVQHLSSVSACFIPHVI